MSIDIELEPGFIGPPSLSAFMKRRRLVQELLKAWAASAKAVKR